jgi:hypothetical protein
MGQVAPRGNTLAAVARAATTAVVSQQHLRQHRQFAILRTISELMATATFANVGNMIAVALATWPGRESGP